MRFLRSFLLTGSFAHSAAAQSSFFNRIATFYTCSQVEPNCNTNTGSSAEIVDATPDGRTLAYVDNVLGAIGFVDINDPFNPRPLGTVSLSGGATGVSISKEGKYALAGVDTSPNFVNPSGHLAVIDIATRTIVTTLSLGGQPDSVKVSPDNKFIAVAIENQRNEGVNSGNPPQLPAGFLAVVDKTNADPTLWTVTNVQLTNLPNVRFPEDPEPEYVDIDANNVAIVTLQENNAIVKVDLNTRTVLLSYSCGTATVSGVDTVRNNIIAQVNTITDARREPDALALLADDHVATADEGDLTGGGTRGFTIFDFQGNVVFTSGNELEHEVARLGHYPERRSNTKGNEPEGMIKGTYGGKDYLFVLSERASVVFVYDVSNLSRPTHVQTLPCTASPEDAAAIPQRNLLAVASERDSRGDGVRGSISLYQFVQASAPNYPYVRSINRSGENVPIPFGSLSGLACADHPGMRNPIKDTVYTVEDGFFLQSRIFRINTATFPAVLNREIRILDNNGVLEAVSANLVFDTTSRRVHLDQEGIALSDDGSFWIVHEGQGSFDATGNNAVTSPNLLVNVNPSGVITQVIRLPQAINDKQYRFGFSGVAEHKDSLIVTFLRTWPGLTGDTNPRIGIYNKVSAQWKFVFYPVNAVTSQNGGYVGVGDIAPLGKGRFLVLERDNQAGPDAAVKQYCTIDLGDDLTVTDGATLTKTGCVDIISRLKNNLRSPIFEKIEGLCVTNDGRIWINSDNEGVDGKTGESVFAVIGTTTSVSPIVPVPPPPTVPQPVAPQPAPFQTPIAAPIVPPVVPPTQPTRAPCQGPFCFFFGNK